MPDGRSTGDDAGLGDGSRLIKLTKGYYTIVDAADFAYIVAQGPWCYGVKRVGYPGYAVRRGLHNEQRREPWLHQMLLRAPHGGVTDHKNGDSLDNRRSNLRAVTQAVNARNCGLRRNNTSGFTGVFRHKPSGRYRAKISVGGKPRYLGYFATAAEAFSAYRAACAAVMPDLAHLERR